MGTIPDTIPYQEFFELRKEVCKLQCSLNLALRILGGLASLSEEEIEVELDAEMEKGSSENLTVLSPINNNFVHTAQKKSDSELSQELSKPNNNYITEVPLNSISSKKIVKNNSKRLADSCSVILQKKPRITPVAISTLLQDSPKQDNTICSSSSLSNIDVECMKTNNLLSRLMTNEISVDVKNVEGETDSKIQISPDKLGMSLNIVPSESVPETFPMSTNRSSHTKIKSGNSQSSPKVQLNINTSGGALFVSNSRSCHMTSKNGNSQSEPIVILDENTSSETSSMSNSRSCHMKNKNFQSEPIVILDENTSSETSSMSNNSLCHMTRRNGNSESKSIGILNTNSFTDIFQTSTNVPCRNMIASRNSQSQPIFKDSLSEISHITTISSSHEMSKRKNTPSHPVYTLNNKSPEIILPDVVISDTVNQWESIFERNRDEPKEHVKSEKEDTYLSGLPITLEDIESDYFGNVSRIYSPVNRSKLSAKVQAKRRRHSESSRRFRERRRQKEKAIHSLLHVLQNKNAKLKMKAQLLAVSLDKINHFIFNKSSHNVQQYSYSR